MIKRLLFGIFLSLPLFAQYGFVGGVKGEQSPISLPVYDAWALSGAPNTDMIKAHGGTGVSDPNKGFIGLIPAAQGDVAIDWDTELVAGTLTNRAADVLRMRKLSGHFYLQAVGSQTIGGTTGALLNALDLEISSGRFGYNMVPNSLGRVQIQASSGDTTALGVFRGSGNSVAETVRGIGGQTVFTQWCDGLTTCGYAGIDFAATKMSFGQSVGCGVFSLCVDNTGNFALSNNLATLQDANTGNHHVIFGETGAATSEEFTIAANTSGTANTVGSIDFANYGIGVTEKRLIILLGRTDGATNTGALEFYYLGAGTLHLFADFKGSTNTFRLVNQAGLTVTDGQTNLTETSTNATALQVTGAGGGGAGSFTDNTAAVYAMSISNTHATTPYAMESIGFNYMHNAHPLPALQVDQLGNAGVGTDSYGILTSNNSVNNATVFAANGAFGNEFGMSAIIFGNLQATPNGGMVYCSTCTSPSNPCAGGGTGALAFRQNGTWKCF